MQINIASITTEKELHEALANSFGFPDFYGKNWDAFWDVITGLVELPKEVEFVGTAHLQVVLPYAYQQLRTSLAELNREYPELGCQVRWV